LFERRRITLVISQPKIVPAAAVGSSRKLGIVVGLVMKLSSVIGCVVGNPRTPLQNHL
jgi:hypothetical protein